VVAAVRRWGFPAPPGGGAVVLYPFRFEASPAAPPRAVLSMLVTAEARATARAS
jgi:hypothetical protein